MSRGSELYLADVASAIAAIRTYPEGCVVPGTAMSIALKVTVVAPEEAGYLTRVPGRPCMLCQSLLPREGL